ncbi:MAG: hypothetical protein IPH66_17990 [Crocinitomicaceae bacterium]|nr:hypothetical protein [Crocinitomicaceae bacterium]
MKINQSDINLGVLKLNNKISVSGYALFIQSHATQPLFTSDAGPVGYIGIRIRGVDPTRTNVTTTNACNEAAITRHAVVNMPDFASSAEMFKSQRGAGTSSNAVR